MWRGSLAGMRTNGPQSFKVTPMHPLSVDAEPVAARSAATLLGRRALALALMLATVLTVAPRASAATMVLKGRFACNDGGALADPPFPTQPTPAVVAPMALPAVLARPAQMGVQGSARFPVRPDGPAAGFAADR